MSTLSINSIKIKELDEYQVTSLHMEESFGFDLPIGNLKLVIDESKVDLSLKELNLSLLINDIELVLKAFIENVSNLRGSLEYSLVFVPEDYYKVQLITKHSGVLNMIKKCTPNKVTGNPQELSSNSSMDIFQNNLTNYQLIRRFGIGVNKSVVISHRLDSLHFTDITKTATKKLNLDITKKKNTIDVTNTKFKDLKAEITEFSTNGLSNIEYNNNSLMLDNSYAQFYQVMKDNEKYYFSNIATIEFILPVFTEIRVGDLVTPNTEYNTDKLLVVKSIYDITYKTFSQKLIMYAI